MEHDQMMDHTLLEQLDRLDGPWMQGLVASPLNGHSGPADVNPNAPPRAAMQYRQLAPAPVARAASAGSSHMPPPIKPSAPDPLREQDRLLPMANIARLMGTELPADAKIAKDAKVLMQEMVSEFICFVTGEANDFSIAASKKAIGPEDQIAALDNLDLAIFTPGLKAAMEALQVSPRTAPSRMAEMPAPMSLGFPMPLPMPFDRPEASSAFKRAADLSSSMGSMADSDASAETTRLASPVMNPMPSNPEMTKVAIADALALADALAPSQAHWRTEPCHPVEMAFVPGAPVVVAKAVPGPTPIETPFPTSELRTAYAWQSRHTATAHPVAIDDESQGFVSSPFKRRAGASFNPHPTQSSRRH